MVNEKIKELMNERKISQKELAKDLEINESALSRYLSGERKIRIDILNKLAKYFNVSIDELLNETSKEQLKFIELKGIVARNASNLSNEEIKELLNILSNNIK